MDEDYYEVDDELPVALVFTSRHGGPPHVVALADDPRTTVYRCSCRAGATGRDCWAVKRARALLGAPAPSEEATSR